mgnify:CR=1 FL=1
MPTTGDISNIDQDVLAILNVDQELYGSIFLGRLIQEAWEDFLSVATMQVFVGDTKRIIRFGELYATDVSDSREAAPTKTTERTHSYVLNLYRSYINSDDYVSIRRSVESIMDTLHNNYRPTSGRIHLLSTGLSSLRVEKWNKYLLYTAEIRFSLLERISHN